MTIYIYFLSSGVDIWNYFTYNIIGVIFGNKRFSTVFYRVRIRVLHFDLDETDVIGDEVMARRSYNMTKEPAKQMGHNGGVASAKARAKKRDKKEALELVMSMTPPQEALENLKKFYGLENTEMTLFELMWLGQMDKAIVGDAKCARNIADFSGTKPVEKSEIKADVKCDTDPIGDIINALGMSQQKPKQKRTTRKKKADTTAATEEEEE